MRTIADVASSFHRSNMDQDQLVKVDAPVAQRADGDAMPYEQVIRKFLVQGTDAVYAVPLHFQDMHKQACKTISSASMIVHLQSRGNSIILVPTQINVYFVWLAWMQAMQAATLQPTHPKAMYAEFFERMTSEKIIILLPVVCLWVCVKCMEVWELRSNDIMRIIEGVQKARNYRFHVTVQDVLYTEHVLLQLIGFDILKNQENIDKIEETLAAYINFEDMYVSCDAQVIRSLFCIFHDIGDRSE